MFKILVLYCFLFNSIFTSGSFNVSQFLTTKYRSVFNTFFDMKKTGFIDEPNMDALIHSLAEALSLKKGENAYEELVNNYHVLLDLLLYKVDTNQDGKISFEEWKNAWAKLAENPSKLNTWQEHHARSIFKYYDEDGDGFVSKNAFIKPLIYLGLKRSDAEDAFYITSEGADKISRDDFEQRYKEYFSSNDKKAPGNYIFGGPTF